MEDREVVGLEQRVDARLLRLAERRQDRARLGHRPAQHVLDGALALRLAARSLHVVDETIEIETRHPPTIVATSGARVNEFDTRGLAYLSEVRGSPG
jgi:hypothetical protein